MSTHPPFVFLHDDYAFFETHATEAEADVQGYMPHLHRHIENQHSVQFLDFGGGSGRFLTRLLARTRWQPDRLTLHLIEPDDLHRQEAVARLQSFTAHPIRNRATLPTVGQDRFDVILANHVFYFVDDLEARMTRLYGMLTEPGLFLASMAGERSDLVRIWKTYFELLDLPVPFYIAEDVEEVLERSGLTYRKQEIRYDLVFPDSEAHRLHILRFLLGSYLDEQWLPVMLEFFEPHRQGTSIVMHPIHEQFIITRGTS